MALVLNDQWMFFKISQMALVLLLHDLLAAFTLHNYPGSDLSRELLGYIIWKEMQPWGTTWQLHESHNMRLFPLAFRRSFCSCCPITASEAEYDPAEVISPNSHTCIRDHVPTKCIVSGCSYLQSDLNHRWLLQSQQNQLPPNWRHLSNTTLHNVLFKVRHVVYSEMLFRSHQ